MIACSRVCLRGVNLLLLAAVASCTLVDLSGDIHRATCQYDAECEILNDSNAANYEPCRPFRCGVTRYCERAALDYDHDGFSPPACELDRRKRDCDDHDPAKHPEADEICDGLDNDCDDRVDEGVLETQRSVAVEFADATPASDISHAIDAGQGRLALAYVLATSPPSVAVNRIDYYDESAVQAPLQLELDSAPAESGLPGLWGPLHANAAGVGALQRGNFAIAAYLTDEPSRIVAGGFQPPSQSLLSSQRMALYGLRCAADEACGGSAAGPAMPIASPYSEAPALAAGSDGVLVAYVRNPDRASDLCHSNDRLLAKPVLANMLVSAPGNVEERTTTAVAVGSSGDGRSPALLAIPGTSTNGAAFGWLVAYPDTRGVLSIARIAANGGELAVSAPLAKIRSEAGPLHAPLMFFKATANSERALIGVVAQRGCEEASRVVVAMLEATLSSDAGITLALRQPATEVGGADQQRGASLAYSERRNSWAVAYRDSAGLRARLFDDNAMLDGSEPYLLMAAAESSPAADSTALAPLLRNTLGWFAVYAYAEHAPSAGGQIVRSMLRSCDAP